jgi:hypothetical protein
MTRFLNALKESPYFMLFGAFGALWLVSLAPITQLAPFKAFEGVNNISIESSTFSARAWNLSIRNDGEAIEDVDLEIVVDGAETIVAKIRNLVVRLSRRFRHPRNSFFLAHGLDASLDSRKGKDGARATPPKVDVFRGGTIDIETTFTAGEAAREPLFIVSGKNLPPTTSEMLKRASYIKIGLGVIALVLLLSAVLSAVGDSKKP